VAGFTVRGVRRLAVTVLLGAASLWMAIAPLQASETVVRRTTLIVHDIEASMAFYRDVLGFQVWLDLPGQVSSDSLPSHASVGDPSRFVIMKGRDPWIGMVGLLQYGAARPLPETPESLAPGDAVLMLETQALDAIYQRMQRAGTPILRAPRSSEVTGADGSRWTARFLFAFDPDGHLLEINQRIASGSEQAAAAAVALRRRYVDYRYGQLHLREARPARGTAAKPPLLLFHQTPLSGKLYEALLPKLAEGRAVYAIDTPGYGESDPPPAPLSIEGYAAAIGDFLGTLAGPVDLLGYHTGVLLALDLARQFPERVRRVVLVSIPLFDEERRAGYQPDRDPISEDGSHLAAMWDSSWHARADGQTKERIAEIVAEKQRAGGRSWWAGPAIFAYDTAASLRSLSQPALVLRPRDGLWDNTGAALELLSDARSVEFPDWAYGFFDTQPAAVAAVVNAWLDEQPAASGAVQADPDPGQ
jgi:pimeloyl-ACP methyl ester carboxylesterase/catechol 2,3-dioxygenase-like lactoylglutathione lyase family enzyme